MSKVEKTQIGNLSIEGFAGDYVYETIKRTKDYYESALLKKWLPYISSNKVILDIGANLGNHTLFWASHLSYEKIFSFEPYRPNYERLFNNIKNNGLQNIYPICKGVGNKCGFTNITEFHEDNYGGTTLSQEISESGGEIPLTDIDSFCSENGLSQVDFIKIDTEGFELNVLNGMKNCLLKFHPDLWVEVTPISFSAVMTILSEPEYVLADVDGFNMLFLSNQRHTALKRIELKTVLSASFHNLERVNIYYKNYITAKAWVASKNDKIEQDERQIEKYSVENDRIKVQLNECNKKYKKSLENYSTVKSWLESSRQENERLKSELKKENELIQKMEEQLFRCFHDYDFNISRIEQFSHIITRLEIQNSSLIQKNDEQKAILDKIDNNFFGRLAIKLYHLYQRLFHK